MNAKKARKLRKEVYGDMSLMTREYANTPQGTVNTGLRMKYLLAKKLQNKRDKAIRFSKTLNKPSKFLYQGNLVGYIDWYKRNRRLYFFNEERATIRFNEIWNCP